MAQETIFGWVVSGPRTTTRAHEQQSHASVNHCIIREPLDNLIRKFCQLEELMIPIGLNEEDQKCEDHFKTTHTRDKSGRYTESLPFKTTLPLENGESYIIARKCLERQRRRLLTTPQRQVEYDGFLQEYLDLGHMSLSPNQPQPDQKPVYLPYHAVLRQDSTTSLIRVVFNAFSGTTNGKTLNDHLHVGPQLLPDLLDVILRWRMHPIALRADIEKMFRQILVTPGERHLQRILWQPPGSTEVNSYDLKTVTYGTAPAPYLSNRTLKQLAQDERARFPRAAAILERDFYVDDVLTGASSIQEARETQEELQKLLLAGGMNLGKWASSHPESLASVPRIAVALDPTSQLDQKETVKVLGVQWNMNLDAFKFSVSADNPSKATKRGILSTVARIFDPVGWLTPTTICAKMRIHELWLLGMDWDDEVPEAIRSQWETFQAQLTRLQEININRYVGWTPESQKLELHGFRDVSTQAYAAVVYLRIRGNHDELAEVKLLLGNSKVAPIQHQTVAKLELCTAHLLARVLEKVKNTMKLDSVPLYAWSDSQIVLAWLQKHSSHWPTFIANRVSDIQTRIPTVNWRHVPTSTNLADCASRGIPPAELVSHELW
ncbi:uncharacterized protein LOC107044257 [Diachasma alloeum]|uniref:uncharacterized protein LOC107044257 n=1 Tax=Diachasma alloeum TaxID=454923 RepID=UPI000738199F|nr:uncharacterized protein LOC107044257 [Diachasma alloeum]